MSWADKITKLQQQNSLDIAMRRAGVNDLLKKANKHIDSVSEERKNVIAKQVNTPKRQMLNIQKQTRDYYKEKLEEKVKKCKQLINTYQLQTTNQERLRELIEIRGQEHKNLSDLNDGIIDAVYTNNRRVVYQTPELSSLKTARRFITIIYYLIFLLILVNGIVITKSLYNYKALLILFIYFSLPFLVDLIVLRSYDTVDAAQKYLGENAPKNVYKNM